MSGALRVALIGCGEVVQAIHWPTLATLGRSFQVSVCCDADQGVAENMARRCGARPSDDPFAAIASDDVDVILVGAPDAFHVEYVLAACDAGKQGVLVEKPLSMNARMARDAVDGVGRSNTAVVVAYPHLFDPMTERAQAAWREAGPLVFGKFTTIIGPNQAFAGDSAEVTRATNLSPLDIALAQFNYAVAATEVIGASASFANVTSHALLAGLTIHDLPVMRRLLGEPDDILFAKNYGGEAPPGVGLDIILKYGGGRMHIEAAVIAARECIWGLELRDCDRSVAVTYPTSFALAAESVCSVRDEHAGAIRETQHRGVYQTGFKREWLHLRDVIRNGAPNLSTVADAARDLELVGEIACRLA